MPWIFKETKGRANLNTSNVNTVHLFELYGEP